MDVLALAGGNDEVFRQAFEPWSHRLRHNQLVAVLGAREFGISCRVYAGSDAHDV